VVGFEFESGELAFEIGFSGFLVDEKNLCLARCDEDFTICVVWKFEGIHPSDGKKDGISLPEVSCEKAGHA
jgi:hypothetical protein